MNQLENILNQSLSLFIIIPLIAFLLLHCLKNKSEKPIGLHRTFTKVFYIVIAVVFVAGWLVNGLYSNQL